MTDVNRRNCVKLLGLGSLNLLLAAHSSAHPIARTQDDDAGDLWRIEPDRLDLLNSRTGLAAGSLVAPQVKSVNERNFHIGTVPPAQEPWTTLHLLNVKRRKGSVSFSWGGTGPFEIIQHFEKASRPLAVRMTVEVQWTGKSIPAATASAELWLKIPCRMQGVVQNGVSFPYENWRCEPMDFEIGSNPWRASWGCHQFRFQGGNRTMYLPLAAFSADKKQYLSVLLGERSSFTVDVKGDQIWFSRKFFVPARQGARDAEIELHDGLPPAKYEIFLSVTPKPTWEDLYWDFFLARYPGFTNSPAAQLPNVMSGGISDFPMTDAWIRRIYSYGNRVLMPNNKIQFTIAYLRQGDMFNLSLAEKMGMAINYIGVDRFAYDTREDLTYGVPSSALRPEFAWEKVPDALIMSPKGKPRNSWNGKDVSMSPQFSYARRILAAVKQRFHRVSDHGGMGVYVDYYYDAKANDNSQHYGDLPFYPQDVSDLWFLRELSGIAHKNKHFLWLNCLPPELMSAQRFYDATSCDCDLEMAVQFKLQSVFKPFVHYGNSTYPAKAFTSEGWLRGSFPGLLYGAAVPAWAFQPQGADTMVNNAFFLFDVERGRPLFARNGYLGSRLAVSAACAGDYDKDMWAVYRHREGGIYAVTINNAAVPVHRHIPLNHPHLKLGKSTKYARIVWDLQRGGETLGEPLAGDKIAGQGWNVDLAPGQIKMLCVEPAKTPLTLSYFADLGSDFPWVRSATDKILSAEVVTEGPLPGPIGYHGSPKYTMRGWPGIQFEMQFGYRSHQKPSYISVTGTQEYAIQWKEGVIKVWGTQTGNVSVVFNPMQGGKPIAQGDILRVSEAFHDAAVAYNSNKSMEGKDWSLPRDGWSTQGKKLHLAESKLAMVSAVWKGSLGEDYQITFQTAFVLATTKPLTTHEASCPPASLQFLVGNHAGKEIWIGTDPATGGFPHLVEDGHSVERGLDTALYPNPYWPEYLRPYDWRIRRQGDLITLAISYDGGATFEDLLPWKIGKSFTPQFGVACKNAALTLQDVVIKQAKDVKP